MFAALQNILVLNVKNWITDILLLFIRKSKKENHIQNIQYQMCQGPF